MKRSILIIAAAIVTLMTGCGKNYESVKGDSLNARIYTLDNGLKVYMTVNKDEPRIQTYIAMHVGSKNDPIETTGLAHYFEHLMFKGTKTFGTSDYAAEEPLLDEIERQFEIYRNTTDPDQRKAIYKVIDSISLKASEIAIANEYDKAMSIIGANGSNAWTSFDETVYTEDIPSNQVENWAKIQSDRVQNAVIRGFHTELETVYEEQNMYAVMDQTKVENALFPTLFPNHAYGQHPVIGFPEHLKNPSITNIKNYYKTYYVPNNCAICLSGDFDPDEMIKIIEKYFGGWAPNPELPSQEETEEVPLTEPVIKEVVGQEAELAVIAWRGPHNLSGKDGLLSVMAQVLYNGKCGLIDLDLNQQQKVLGVAAVSESLADRTLLFVQGMPKEGQSLEEVKDLVLAEVAKVRNGEFDESILEAIVNNYRLSEIRALENNSRRAQTFVSSFINNESWDYTVKALDRVAAVTKEDLVAFANEYFKDDNFVAVYKRQGEDPNVVSIEKPAITPINTNRDKTSAFLQELAASQVEPIEPEFVDIKNALKEVKIADGATLRYLKNTSNERFGLYIRINDGLIDDNKLDNAFQYLSYLGTDNRTAEEIAAEMYRLACSYTVNVRDNFTLLSLSGLSENMSAASDVLVDLLNNAKVDPMIYQAYISDVLKNRQDLLTDQRSNFYRLQEYVQYGPFNSYTNIPSQEELLKTSPEEMLASIKPLLGMEYEAFYYGPAEPEQVAELIKSHLLPSENLTPAPNSKIYPMVETESNKVFLAQYDANQMMYSTYSSRPDETFESVPMSVASLYSDYFGGGMNAVVFQEMREARGLAYTAQASYSAPSYIGHNYAFTTYIATQNDKLADAMDAFHEIVNNMPQSEFSFNMTKENDLAYLRTLRTTRERLIDKCIMAELSGIWEDTNERLFNELPALQMSDLVEFQQKYIKDRPTHYYILSDIKALDLKYLSQYGDIKVLSQKDIFGY